MSIFFCGEVRRMSSLVCQPKGRNCIRITDMDISVLLWALQTLRRISISNALQIVADDVLGAFNHPLQSLLLMGVHNP